MKIHEIIELLRQFDQTADVLMHFDRAFVHEIEIYGIAAPGGQRVSDPRKATGVVIAEKLK